MFKALASLALAMTGGAGLLAWLEPKPQNYADDPALASNPLLSRHLARRIVTGNGGAQAAHWQAIEIVALAPAGPTLAATLPPDDLHFIVNEDGTLRALPRWSSRGADAGQREVIRIGLAGSRPDRRVSSSQWQALRALLIELKDHAQAASGALPVRLVTAQGPTGQAGTPPGNHLRMLLLRDGFLG